MRILILTLFVLTLSFPAIAQPSADAPASAADTDPAATLSVKLINGTTGLPGRADVIEIFSLSGGGMSALSSQQQAGPDVAFPGLTSGDTYLIRAEYQGASYSEQLTFQPGEGMELVLYDSTSLDPGLQINQVQLVLEVEGNTLFVNRRYEVNNPTLTTYSNEHGTFLFSVPPEGEDIVAQVSHGRLPIPIAPQSTAEAGRYSIRRPIPPLKTTVDVRYSLSYESGAATVHETLDHDAERLVVAVTPGDVKVTSGDLVDQGVEESHNAHLFSAEDRKKGDTLTVSLEGFGTAGAAEHNHEEGDDRVVSMSAHKGSLVLAYTLGFAAILILTVALSWGRQPSTAAVDDLRHKSVDELILERDALLMRMAELDNQNESGGVAKADYNKRRDEYKRRALAVMRRLAELGHLTDGGR